MKKIIASAVAVAFAAPVWAADITISGDQGFSLQDSNGASTSALDGDFNIKASTETANGFAVSADINIAEDAADDGSASLPFLVLSVRSTLVIPLAHSTRSTTSLTGATSSQTARLTTTRRCCTRSQRW